MSQRVVRDNPKAYWMVTAFFEPMAKHVASGKIDEYELSLQYDVHGYKVLRRAGKSWLSVAKFFLKRKASKVGCTLFC